MATSKSAGRGASGSKPGLKSQTLASLDQELANHRLRPLYWFSGEETLRLEQALERVKRHFFAQWGDQASIEKWEGTEVTAEALLDGALSPSLLFPAKLMVVSRLHALKDLEGFLNELPDGEARAASEVPIVIVAFSHILDRRKKASALVGRKAFWIEFEEIPEAQRADWVLALLQKYPELTAPDGGDLGSDPHVQKAVEGLSQLEPWSLMRVDSELRKWAVGGIEAVLGGEADPKRSGQKFLDGLLFKKWEICLREVPHFWNSPDEVFPLIGLIAWNVKQALAWKLTGSSPKMAPFVAEKMRKWISLWSETELVLLQSKLLELDTSLKQKPLHGLAVWSGFIQSLPSQL